MGNENRVAAIEKQVTEDIGIPAHFCMQDTIDNCCTNTSDSILRNKPSSIKN